MAVTWYEVDRDEPPMGTLLVWNNSSKRPEIIGEFPHKYIGNPEFALTHWAIINKPKDV